MSQNSLSQSPILAKPKQLARLAGAGQWLKLAFVKSSPLQPTLLLGSVIIMPATVIHKAPLIGVYALAFAVTLLVSLSLISARLNKVAIISAIIPVSYWVSLALPQKTAVTRMAYLYGCILFLSLTYRYLLAQKKPQRSKAVKKPRYLLMGFLALGVGVVSGLTALLLLPHSVFIDVASPVSAIGLAIICALIEVIYFQGLLQAHAMQIMPRLAAAVLAALAFASMSLVGPWTALPALLLSGASGAAIYFIRSQVTLAVLAGGAAKLIFVIWLIVS